MMMNRNEIQTSGNGCHRQADTMVPERAGDVNRTRSQGLIRDQRWYGGAILCRKKEGNKGKDGGLWRSLQPRRPSGNEGSGTGGLVFVLRTRGRGDSETFGMGRARKKLDCQIGLTLWVLLVTLFKIRIHT